MRPVLVLITTIALHLSQAQARTSLSVGELLTNSPLEAPVDASAYAPFTGRTAPRSRFEGRLRLTAPIGKPGFKRLIDNAGYLETKELRTTELPPFDFTFVQDGEDLIPLTRGMVITRAHPSWEFVLETGRVWSEPGDKGYTRAALPFSIQERNANCLHNGILTFLFRDGGSISNVVLQIGSETCPYLQFDLWGKYSATYTPEKIENSDDFIRFHRRWKAGLLPTKPIKAVETDYTGAVSKAFGSRQQIKPKDMTLYGFIIDGVHYTGGCMTRYGRHPYCDAVTVPSYSFAKSLVGGLGLMRLELLYPGAMNANISEHVPACADTGTWDNVTFENVLDMATGNYNSSAHDVDERSNVTRRFLFFTPDHAGKIEIACTAFPRTAAPGSRWVYHTTDTYVLGTAMASFLRQETGSKADIYVDLLVRPIWLKLGLSPTSFATRRTYDRVRQPFVGYGLSFLRSDLAKLAHFLGPMEGKIDNRSIFAPKALAAALQRDPRDRGLESLSSQYRYNNGFWAWNAKSMLGCANDAWVPFMSGYGGLTLALFPNGTAYYYISDGSTFAWSLALQEAHKIRPICAS